MPETKPTHPSKGAVQAESLRTLAAWIDEHPELTAVPLVVDTGIADANVTHLYGLYQNEEQARELLGTYAAALGASIEQLGGDTSLTVTAKVPLTKPFPLWQENLEITLTYEIDPDDNADYWAAQRANRNSD